MKKILLSIICICLFLSYFVYISYYHIDITTYEIESDKINNDINIVMIADLHDYNCKIQDDVISHIKELNPDMILCVGDMIDNKSTSDDDLLSFLSQLTEISNVYMSLGNHEYDYYNTHINHIEDTGVEILEEEYKDININNTAIRLGGMYNYAFSQESGGIGQDDMDNSDTYRYLHHYTDTSLYTIMMAHRPDSFIYCDAYLWDIDLVLSGHTHGGQAILPFIGGIYAPEQGFFPKYDYGLYELKDMTMIITRGLSTTQSYIPRINNPSEIINIKLKRS